MNPPNPNLAVKVDITNPGQFFACCGLLELAHRLWPGVEGWFESGGFYLEAQSAQGPEILKTCLNVLWTCELQTDNQRGEDAFYPIQVLHEKKVIIVMDWWINPDGRTSPLKLWAGRQTSLSIVQMLRNACQPTNAEPELLFVWGAALTGRFGVDPRAAWNALDAGFSPNEQQMEVYSYPAVELLAAVGLQGFRPYEINRSTWRYSTWNNPLPVAVARAASTGSIIAHLPSHYRFEIAKRGSFKGFTFSTFTGELS